MRFLSARSVVELDAASTSPIDVLDVCRSFLQRFGERHRLRKFDEEKLELIAEAVMILPGGHFAYCQISVLLEHNGGKLRVWFWRYAGDSLVFGYLHALMHEHLVKTFVPGVDPEHREVGGTDVTTEGPGVHTNEAFEPGWLTPLVDMLVYSHDPSVESEACMALASMVNANPLYVGEVYSAVVEGGIMEKLIGFVDEETLSISYPSRVLLRAFDSM